MMLGFTVNSELAQSRLGGLRAVVRVPV